MIMNAISHPKASANAGILKGATKAPIEAPALKIEVAKARSFLGKYSAVTLMAAGKLPDSPIANIIRQPINNHTLTVSPKSPICDALSIVFKTAMLSTPSIQHVAIPHAACIQAPMLHRIMAKIYPFLVPIQSINLPAKSEMAA